MMKLCQACRYPITFCCCGFPDYVRLEEEEEDSDITIDERMEITFYNHSDVSHDLTVERNQSTMDLCEILAVKYNVSKTVHLSIFEYWEDLALERPLEDDESVLMAYSNMRNFSFHARIKYRFKNNFQKYEFFDSPEQFFPPYMLDINIPVKDTEKQSGVILRQHMVATMSKCPDVISQVYIQEDSRKKWKKTYMLLKDQDILISQKKRSLIKLMRTPVQQVQVADNQGRHLERHLTILPNDVHVFANLTRYYVYTALNPKILQRAPTDFCIVLRPTGTLPKMADMTQSKSPSGGKGGLLRCMACDSERIRSCWVLSMRLAKYGKQIRENYKALRSRRTISKKEETKSYKRPSDDPENPHVPMDFSERGGGKIISDPKEADAVAAAEGHGWRRRLRHGYNRPPTGGAGPSGVSGNRAIDISVHLALPWFFANMPRERATELIEDQGTVDGVFLVRDSRSNPGGYVISYVYNYRVFHQPIQTINERDELFLSIDGGATRFYDLQQLVEFYRLNRGTLPTRLTHYVSLMMTSYKERGSSSSATSPSIATSPISATSPIVSKSPSAGSSKGLLSGSSKGRLSGTSKGLLSGSPKGLLSGTSINLFGCISKGGSSKGGSSKGGSSKGGSSKGGSSKGGSPKGDSSKWDSSKGDSSKGGSSKGGSSKGGSSKGG